MVRRGLDGMNNTSGTKEDERKPCPAVSFIIPTFNRADALGECLRHLERQTFTDFEVIVIDDGSTDGTPEILAESLKASPLKLRAMRQPNNGPAVARNQAIAMAEAAVCIVIGDDILCSSDFCLEHVRFHRENPGLESIGLGLTVWSESLQTVTPFMRWMDQSGAQFAYRDLIGGVPPDWRHFYTSNLSAKTQLLRENRFHESFAGANWMMEDMELGYRLQAQGLLRISFLPRARAEHVHPTDFRKACRRAYAAGLSARTFDELWPSRAKVAHGWVHRMARQALCVNAWLLPPAAALTRWITAFWCPNPLMHPVLAWHTAVARQRGR